jgi:hypothetical protein
MSGDTLLVSGRGGIGASGGITGFIRGCCSSALIVRLRAALGGKKQTGNGRRYEEQVGSPTPCEAHALAVQLAVLTLIAASAATGENNN